MLQNPFDKSNLVDINSTLHRIFFQRKGALLSFYFSKSHFTLPFFYLKENNPVTSGMKHTNPIQKEIS